MAHKVTAWSCDYKCGEQVKTSKQAMERHEKRCFHNPEMQACQTCEYWTDLGWEMPIVCAHPNLEGKNLTFAGDREHHCDYYEEADNE